MGAMECRDRTRGRLHWRGWEKPQTSCSSIILGNFKGKYGENWAVFFFSSNSLIIMCISNEDFYVLRYWRPWCSPAVCLFYPICNIGIIMPKIWVWAICCQIIFILASGVCFKRQYSVHKIKTIEAIELWNHMIMIHYCHTLKRSEERLKRLPFNLESKYLCWTSQR